jgi:hypothetical protein
MTLQFFKAAMNVALIGSRVVARAFVDAYRQAAQSAFSAFTANINLTLSFLLLCVAHLCALWCRLQTPLAMLPPELLQRRNRKHQQMLLTETCVACPLFCFRSSSSSRWGSRWPSPIKS